MAEISEQRTGKEFDGGHDDDTATNAHPRLAVFLIQCRQSCDSGAVGGPSVGKRYWVGGRWSVPYSPVERKLVQRIYHAERGRDDVVDAPLVALNWYRSSGDHDDCTTAVMMSDTLKNSADRPVSLSVRWGTAIGVPLTAVVSARRRVAV